MSKKKGYRLNAHDTSLCPNSGSIRPFLINFLSIIKAKHEPEKARQSYKSPIKKYLAIYMQVRSQVEIYCQVWGVPSSENQKECLKILLKNIWWNQELKWIFFWGGKISNVIPILDILMFLKRISGHLHQVLQKLVDFNSQNLPVSMGNYGVEVHKS